MNKAQNISQYIFKCTTVSVKKIKENKHAIKIRDFFFYLEPISKIDKFSNGCKF